MSLEVTVVILTATITVIVYAIVRINRHRRQ
jgi:hypothetical protein